MFVGEGACALKYDVESALEIAIADFLLRQVAIHQINRLALGYGSLPQAARWIVAGIGKRQDFEALSGERAGQAGPAIRREVHDFLAAGAAVKTHEGAIGIDLVCRRIKRAMHVPFVAVAAVARGYVGAREVAVGVGLCDSQPFLPGELE